MQVILPHPWARRRRLPIARVHSRNRKPVNIEPASLDDEQGTRDLRKLLTRKIIGAEITKSLALGAMSGLRYTSLTVERLEPPVKR